jgi:hypothetical protein
MLPPLKRHTKSKAVHQRLLRHPPVGIQPAEGMKSSGDFALNLTEALMKAHLFLELS